MAESSPASGFWAHISMAREAPPITKAIIKPRRQGSSVCDEVSILRFMYFRDLVPLKAGGLLALSLSEQGVPSIFLRIAGNSRCHTNASR